MPVCLWTQKFILLQHKQVDQKFEVKQDKQTESGSNPIWFAVTRPQKLTEQKYVCDLGYWLNRTNSDQP